MSRQGLRMGLVAAVLWSTSHAAVADGVTIGGDLHITIPALTSGSTYTAAGTETLNFGPDMLRFFNATQTQFDSYADGTVLSTTDLDERYLTVSVSVPMTSVYTNGVEPGIVGINSSGGLLLGPPYLEGVSSSNALTFSDLSVNLVTHEVIAKAIGGNGVGTIDALLFLNAADLQTTYAVIGHTDSGLDVLDYTVTLSGLTLTDMAHQTFVQAMALNSLGQAALNDVKDVGTLSMHFQVTGKTEDLVAAVPEPSNYVLMGLGLVGLTFIRSRRQSQA